MQMQRCTYCLLQMQFMALLMLGALIVATIPLQGLCASSCLMSGSRSIQ
jgi:hypothetical protein